MHSDAIQELESLKEKMFSYPNAKGKQDIITRIRSSVRFLRSFKVDDKTAGLILAERQKEVGEYNQRLNKK